GVYLVTGGARGLGSLFARFAASRAGARLVLSGRSEPDARVEQVIRDVRTAGGEALYIRADVSRAEEAAALVQGAKSAFGAIHGIVHGAGVIRDSFLVNKDETSLREVLAPKVWGAVHLDSAAQNESLDWLA